MMRRKLGRTDLELTEIGFGAWAIGGGGWRYGWGPQDDTEAVAAIRRALDLGINWIDTAAVYGLGHSEEVVGRALEGRRSGVIIATKCGLVWDHERHVAPSLARDSVRRECEASLRRLRTDRIDLYQIHWPNDEVHLEEGWDTVGRLIDEGKVRYGGVSNFLFQHLEQIRRIRPVASLQSPYNMFHREVESELLDYCKEHHMGVLAYSPMVSGLLSGRFNRERLAPDDWRNHEADFNEPSLSANLEFVESLRPIAEKYEKTVAQFAVAWVLRKTEITSAIVGARRPSQIEETIGGGGWSIQPADLEEVEKLMQHRKQRVESPEIKYRH